MTKIQTTLVVAFSLVIGGSLVYFISEPQIEYVKQVEVVEPPSLSEEIAVRASDIMASPEFQDEVRAMATARALYALSIERQDIAVELSEMAMSSYLKSKELASNWTIHE
jgi:hypothetical protein